MKLSEALGWFYLSMEGVKSPTTVTFYKNRLPSLITELGDLDLDCIITDHLRLWRKRIAERPLQTRRRSDTGRLSVYTLDQYVRACRRFFRWAYEDGKIDRDPAKRLERPPLPDQKRRGIPKSDLKKMIRTAKLEQNARDYAIILLLADTACRVGGIAGLRLADLDLDGRRALVHEKGRGGNNKERPIFLQPETVAALRAYLAERPTPKRPNDHVFLGQGHGRHAARGWHALTESGIYQVLKRIAQKAGIESGYNPHNFRHACIRGWLNQGMPLSKASQLAGHSSTKITGDIYGTSNETELQEAHDRYNWLT